MKRQTRNFLLGGFACLAFMSMALSSVSAQSVIVYGNGSYGNAASNRMSVRPQPSRQYSSQQYLPQQYPSQSGYSVVVPQSRVQAYDRVTPQPYRGAGQRVPTISYNTHEEGFFYGAQPAYGYGLSFGNPNTGSTVTPGSSRVYSRNRLFPRR